MLKWFHFLAKAHDQVAAPINLRHDSNSQQHPTIPANPRMVSNHTTVHTWGPSDVYVTKA